MSFSSWRHRSDRRHPVAGVVAFRQGRAVGHLQLVDASARGLCMQGDIEHLDPSRSVDLELQQLGEVSVKLRGRLCWKRSNGLTTLHGWVLESAPVNLAALLGTPEDDVPIALEDEEIELIDHDRRFGDLLGTG